MQNFNDLPAASLAVYQQLQIDARKQLAQSEAQKPGATNKPTVIEARRQRCRQARYQRYSKVHEAKLS
jgi:DNA-binding IclR family transcriptional regulator